MLNCTLKNWTEFLLKYDDDYEKIVEYYSDIASLIKYYKDNYILEQYFYDRIIDKKNIDCNSQNNSFYSRNSEKNYNYSECEKYKRFYIDFLNEFEKCSECDNEEGRRIYCKSLETIDFTSFSSSNVEKMEFLFAGCSNLVNIKGFENLDTSSLQKTAGMFIECKNLISVNLSSFQLNNISEQNGMFIDNPSLEKLDLGNTTDIS